MIDKVNALDTNAGALVSSVQSSVDLRGNVRIIVDDEKLGRYVHFDQHNIIVNGAKGVMASLLANGYASYPIWGLAVGLGDPSWDIINPPAPQASTTGLVSQTYYVKEPSSRTVVDSKTAKFTFVLAQNEGNGGYDGGQARAYTEAGLYAYAAPSQSGSVLFAYETFPALIKNNTRQITFEWSIIF